jgi:hypothetical protein
LYPHQDAGLPFFGVGSLTSSLGALGDSRQASSWLTTIAH